MPTKKKSLSAGAAQQEFVRIDQLIRDGKATQAREEIQAIAAKKLTRDSLVSLAALARRSEIPDVALKLLSPVVLPNRPLAVPAKADEIAEYAANLVKIGATTEALTFLSTVDPKDCPAVHLYKAYALFAVWSYKEAVPLFQAYLSHPKSDPYFKVVARVNLASSLTFERRTEEALLLIDVLLGEAKAMNSNLLLGNLLEMKAVNAIQSRDWGLAEASLGIAENFLAQTGSRFSLFVLKWKAVARLLREGAKPEILLQLKQVREEAQKQTHWETLRDCDRALAIATRDETLAVRLFFGTPFQSFRAKLLADWAGTLTLPDFYDWNWGPGAGPRLDLETGEIEKAKEALKPGGIVHRLLRTLASDFYRPQRMACLFAALYPGEHFSPSVATMRVQQACNRLRQWFSANRLPLRIEVSSGYYRLVAEGPFTLRVARPDRAAASPLVTALKRRWPTGAWFSIKEASHLLKLSPRSTLRLMNELRDAGALVRKGAGSSVRYGFADPAALSPAA